MVLILDGYSDNVAHMRRKTGRMKVNFKFATVVNLNADQIAELPLHHLTYF